jgi:hypothetical protein
LIKDAASEMPIKEMFVGLSDAASRLWRERLIGVLEEMPVGAMATTLSSRQDGQQFEGVYDFLYVFHKVDKNTIWAYGLGAQLNRFEQVAVNNTQAVVARNNWLLLDTGATADEIRGRAFAYPPDWFDSPMALYTWLFESAGILKDQNEIQTQFDVAALRQADKLVAMRPVAEEMVEHIFLGHSTQRLVQREQMRQLWLAYPDEMGGWRDRGLLGVMLPCGWVDLGFDLGMTAGDGLLMTSFGVECVQKKCRRCGNTDIAETDTKCRICSWSPGNSV